MLIIDFHEQARALTDQFHHLTSPDPSFHFTAGMQWHEGIAQGRFLYQKIILATAAPAILRPIAQLMKNKARQRTLYLRLRCRRTLLSASLPKQRRQSHTSTPLPCP